MAGVSSVGDIKSATLYINNILVSKGYIRDDERLEFGPIDGKEKSDPDIGEDETTRNETSEKDVRTINVIYSLLKTIDDDSKTNESNAQLAKDLKRKQDEENTKTERLNSKANALQKQVTSLEHLNESLESTVDSLRKSNSHAKDQVGRLKNIVKQHRQQFANELRRRDMQIGKLKERLQDTTRRTKTLSGVSGTLSKSYNSYSTTALSSVVENNESTDSIDSVSSELASMNNSLVAENNALLVMLHEIRDSLSFVTDETHSNIISQESATYNENPQNSTEVLIRCKSTEELKEEVSDCVDYIKQALHSPNYVSVVELKEKETEIQKLKDQLSDANTNWQKAISTMDQWKKYRENRDKSMQPRVIREGRAKNSMTNTTTKDASKSESPATKSDYKANATTTNDTPNRASFSPKKASLSSSSHHESSPKTTSEDRMQKPPTTPTRGGPAKKTISGGSSSYSSPTSSSVGRGHSTTTNITRAAPSSANSSNKSDNKPTRKTINNLHNSSRPSIGSALRVTAEKSKGQSPEASPKVKEEKQDG